MSETERKDGQDVWKWVSGILAAILLTGLASWFAFTFTCGQSACASCGQSLRSCGVGTVLQRDYAAQNAEVRALVQENATQVQALTVEMAKTNERLQALIERIDREGR